MDKKVKIGRARRAGRPPIRAEAVEQWARVAVLLQHADRSLDVAQVAEQGQAQRTTAVDRTDPYPETAQRLGHEVQIGQGNDQLIVVEYLKSTTPDGHYVLLMG